MAITNVRVGDVVCRVLNDKMTCKVKVITLNSDGNLLEGVYMWRSQSQPRVYAYRGDWFPFSDPHWYWDEDEFIHWAMEVNRNGAESGQ